MGRRQELKYIEALLHASHLVRGGMSYRAAAEEIRRLYGVGFSAPGLRNRLLNDGMGKEPGFNNWTQEIFDDWTELRACGASANFVGRYLVDKYGLKGNLESIINYCRKAVGVPPKHRAITRHVAEKSMELFGEERDWEER